MQLTETRKGVIALIILAWVFATMALFARTLDQQFELFEQTYLRIGLAFVLASVIFFKEIRWSIFATLSKRDAAILIFRSISLYLGIVLFTEAVLHTTLANASLVALFPLLPLLGYLMLGEKVKLRTLLYIALGFVGAALIVVQDMANITLGYGELAALASLIFFDVSYVARKWQSDTLSDKESTVSMFLVGALFLFVSSFVAGEALPEASDFGPFMVGTLVIAALFNVVNLYLTNYGFKRVKVAVAGNLLTLEIVFALLYSIFLYGEVPVLREIVGGALIVVSVILINQSEQTT